MSIFTNSIVNDVTNINPIVVAKVIAPTTVEEIKAAVKGHEGPISIGGGRYSMGGQTATEDAIQIDMREFKKILKLDVENRKITVQSGIRWRDIQDEIDKVGLSLRIMQTYSNFTVGGSLSVNAHGRYVGEGPLVRVVESIKIVLADGSEVISSPFQNSKIFYAAIGGYGGIGVITEATLNLTENEKIKREITYVDTSDYKKYFFEHIRRDPNAVFHNGNVYGPDFKTIRLETWSRTEEPLTNEARLIPEGQRYWLEPNVITSISSIPYGSEIRQNYLDPILNRKPMVFWRNYEASYDVAQLEPWTPRVLWTYVLQEYFVPIRRFDEFIPKMRDVFKKYDVNVINVSIRHALPDPGTYLAWAPEEVFSFVIYYKQWATDSARKEVGKWTREMIDAALSVEGRYYLPYQIHATEIQFKKAYPKYKEFFAIKKKLDPKNKFRNKLWDKYYKVE